MSTWLLAGLGLYLVQIFLPTILFLPAEGLGNHLASRDDLPAPSRYVGRARRALANMQEYLPIFLGLGLLAMVIEGTDLAQATLGAMVFVIARAVYVVAYLVSVPGTRTLVWAVGFGGLVMMLLALG